MNGRTIASALPAGSGPSPPAASGAEKDARAWVHQVYRTHFDFVWRTIRGLGVPAAQVDDAVQDVFIVVYRRRHDFHGQGQSGGSERSWLFRIAHFVAGNHRRTRRRKGGLLPLREDVEPVSLERPDEQAALNEAAAALSRFVDSLDTDQRNVFVLMELSGASAREAAQALDVKLNTVYSRLRLARARWERFAQSYGEREGGKHG